VSADLATKLSSVDPLPFSRLLYRGVAMHSLRKRDPPEPLFVSSAANRYNPSGYNTLYFGEDFFSAYTETVQEQGGLLLDSPTREVPSTGAVGTEIVRPEPVVLFGASAHVDRLLDLADEGIRTKLGVSLESLRGPWRWEHSQGHIPITHRIGVAVFDSSRFEAIRYPSSKAQQHCCWVIFVDRLGPTSYIEVADSAGYLSGRLP
jgi:RES domain-containing protein